MDFRRDIVFDKQVYIKLIKDFRDNALFDDANTIYYQYRKQESKVRRGISISYLLDVFMGLSCGYGVRPWYAAGWTVAIIFICSSIYWLWDGIRRSKESDEDDEQDASFCDAFYFSVTTFTTIGYGDWYPKDRHRILAVIEGLLGWLTLALFLVTLANVMIRL